MFSYFDQLLELVFHISQITSIDVLPHRPFLKQNCEMEILGERPSKKRYVKGAFSKQTL